MAWTKVDQTDYYALCVIDPELADEVKEIATSQAKHFRDVLRSAIRQQKFRRSNPLKKFWDKLTPEERSTHGSLASQKRWNPREDGHSPSDEADEVSLSPKPSSSSSGS